nr:TcpQ domain-containing protein [Aliidiomarina quisquiliarum]
MADDTLKSNSERLAAEENMELIWWLDKDYVVRAPFQVNADLLQSLDRLARSLNSHHPGSPQAFLCPRQRAILIATSESAESVSHYCTPASNLRSPTR